MYSYSFGQNIEQYNNNILKDKFNGFSLEKQQSISQETANTFQDQYQVEPQDYQFLSLDFPLIRQISKQISYQFQDSFVIPQNNSDQVKYSQVDDNQVTTPIYYSANNLEQQQQQQYNEQDNIDYEFENFQQSSNQDYSSDNYSVQQQYNSHNNQIFSDSSNQNNYSTVNNNNQYSNEYYSNKNNIQQISQYKKNQKLDSKSYVSCMEDLIQFQNKKKVIQKKKIRKQKEKSQKIQVSEKAINNLNLKVINKGSNSIYRQNLKPNTAHLPTLYMNILVPYILQTYKDSFYLRCRKNYVQNNQQQKFFEDCDCQFCKEYHSVIKFKQGHYNSNIQDLNNLWKFPRLRVLSKNFALKHVYHKIMNRNAYRSQVTFISILLSLPLFLKGIKSDSHFYKLL